ncbi:metallophosphoesterase [Candidatus Laterigemmans baculatus]|uniref:metallophosphoesterase n=1 Tax=Candidatus Laterigemmans baculatus TaxID=2770505 RepID=UPI0013DB20C4|nr:metallophosphoesterase [Candidatus Laterigemmans baculatus]
MVGWFLALVAIVGHFGLHLTIYNRLNATGLPRRRLKRIEMGFFATTLLIPLAVVVFYSEHLLALAYGSLTLGDLPWPLAVYSAVCIATVAIFGPPWLLSRPPLHRESLDVAREVRQVRVDRELGMSLARTAKCRWEARFPANQIFDLAIEHKTLPVAGLPEELEQFRIAHLSDIHLTGHIAPDFVRYAVEVATAWQPDLFALTGDLVDKQPCLEWLGGCFSSARARHGCYFVLGNHDLRVPDPGAVRSGMVAAGWEDLGGRERVLSLDGLRLRLLGNEAPWFPAAELAEGPAATDEFRLLLSHSPDQLPWARRRDVRLMLAGHTHGGQGRLPWIGPVLSPSRFGSRYASGSFYIEPTTLHVSRGLSAVHLLRLRCPPELALLTLTRAQLQ